MRDQLQIFADNLKAEAATEIEVLTDEFKAQRIVETVVWAQMYQDRSKIGYAMVYEKD